MSPRASTIKIRSFITAKVSEYPTDIAWLTSQTFGITRQAVNRHLRALIDQGVLEKEGTKKGSRYLLAELAAFNGYLPLEGLEEDVPWSEHIAPLLNGVKNNVRSVCNYGFTEMLNNAIDHSGSEQVRISCSRSAETIRLEVSDRGIGIFRKIREAKGLQDDLEAAVELAKGKLTTDPERHTGEGIFFTSRVFDKFQLLSGELYFSHRRQQDDWLLEDRDDPHGGTLVIMEISTRSSETMQSTFDRFSVDESGAYDFSRTHVPVRLMQVGHDNLVSRSQAKRLMNRVSVFREVLLDFKGVDQIGQAFADEIFRVYRNANPEISIVAVNASPEVDEMITRARDRSHAPQE
jgi:anti-sigma regulatory factor (Ser/Thr protein kinase)